MPARFGDVRVLVFDLDGTLIDSAGDLAAAVNATLAGIAPEAAPLTLQEVRRFVGDGARTLLSRSLAARQIPLAADQALERFLDAYRARLLDTTRLYPGAEEALTALAARHTLAVLTNKPGDMSRVILRGLGVDGCFARVLGGDEAEKKPDPAGLLQLTAQLSTAPARAAMVGDSANDVRTARAAGTLAIGARYGFDCAAMEAERPDALIDGLGELLELLG